MSPEEKIEKKIKDMHFKAGEQMRKKILEDVLEAHQQAKLKDSAPMRSNLGRIIMGSKLARFAAAACIIIAVVIGINYLVGPLSITSVGWADVVESFKSMKFFSATIYIKENASKEPKQIEVWQNSEQKTRIRADGQVLFAQAGQITAGYNFEEKRKLSEEEYDENGLMIAKKLLSVPEFSLNTVVASFYEGRLEEITPLMNPDAMISEDMIVFDVKSPTTPEWMRIWALRESKLPVMIRMWDPRYGRCIDVFMTYSKEQLPDFFEPSKYEKVLLESANTTGGSRTNLAYALLEDGGGRDYVPKDLFEKEGYHMPVIEKSGVTKYGAVWFVVSKSQNRRPDGNIFYGFSWVTDDLGRKYEAISGIHRVDDISVQVFIPDNYPFDKKIPKSVTLQCNVPQQHPDETEQTIGSVELSNLEQNSYWPRERLSETEFDVMLKKASALARKKDYDGSIKIMNFVQELNPDGKYAHQIDRINLNMLISRKEFAQADQLAEKNWKLEIDSFIKAGPNASPERLADYIIAIAANGRIERAAEMFNELKTVRPDYSRYNKAQQKKFLERLKEQVNNSAGYRLVPGLFEAGVSLENVNQILGFNVLENDTSKSYVPEKYRTPPPNK